MLHYTATVIANPNNSLTFGKQTIKIYIWTVDRVRSITDQTQNNKFQADEQMNEMSYV